MMKWSRLQLNTLPIIAIEADKAIQKLEQLITRVNTNAKFQDIQDLNNLRKSIIERIDALDRFYELHYLDSTIAIFHMIKIKLKKAIFRIDNINNETMPIQFLNIPSHINQSQNITKSNSSLIKKQMPKIKNSLKPQIINKTPSKLNSKIKQRQKLRSKDNILKLLQTSRRQEENDTNLMQQHNFYEGNAPTFYENQQYQFYQPLFKAQKKNVPTHKVKSRQANQKLKEKVSPINKKQQNKSKLKTTQTKNEQVKKLLPKPKNNGHTHTTQPSTNINQNKKSSLHTEKHEASKKLTQKSTKVLKPQNKNTKLKTQGQQIRISDPGGQNQDTGSQFRFTIKMSKQQYISLLKLKQSMKNNRKMS